MRVERRLFGIVLIFCLLFLVYLNKMTPSFRQIGKDYQLPNGDRKGWKNIVFWTKYAKEFYLWEDVFKRLVLQECEENRCNLIFDPGSIARADALVFKGKELRQAVPDDALDSYEDPPGPRNPNQIYVFFTMEAPPQFNRIRLQDYDHFFNWTMTYQKSSDVVIPYGKTIKLLSKKKVKYISQAELDKKKLIIWMVSHCQTQSRREELVKSLKRYIKVDQFGRCGRLKCGGSTTIPKMKHGINEQCHSSRSNYVFELAFENSLCKDYVTEKLYRALKFNVIPVVFGGVNYTQFAPPNSFIDARDFKTTADLAKYLKKVAEDVHLYNRYLKWQEQYEVELGSPYKPMICDLCKELHALDAKSSRKTYPSIREWYLKNDSCFNFTFSNYLS